MASEEIRGVLKCQGETYLMAQYCVSCGRKLKKRDGKTKQDHLAQCRKCYREVAIRYI